MSTKPADLAKDKRRLIRRRVRNATDVACRKGSSGMGPNLAVRMLDITEEGVQLVVKQAINPGEELEVCFTPVGCNREVICQIIAIRCRAQDSNFAVAGKFRPPLRYDDIHHIL